MTGNSSKIGTPLFPETLGIPLGDIGLNWEEGIRRNEAEAKKRMEAFFEACLGTFDTQFKCNACPSTFIQDRVTESEPRPIDISNVRFGPELYPARLDTPFPDLWHYFYCPKCGQVYDKDVMINTRGYVPPEVLYRKSYK